MEKRLAAAARAIAAATRPGAAATIPVAAAAVTATAPAFTVLATSSPTGPLSGALPLLGTHAVGGENGLMSTGGLAQPLLAGGHNFWPRQGKMLECLWDFLHSSGFHKVWKNGLTQQGG